LLLVNILRLDLPQCLTCSCSAKTNKRDGSTCFTHPRAKAHQPQTNNWEPIFFRINKRNLYSLTFHFDQRKT